VRVRKCAVVVIRFVLSVVVVIRFVLSVVPLVVVVVVVAGDGGRFAQRDAPGLRASRL